jgi:hypothetical protein
MRNNNCNLLPDHPSVAAQVATVVDHLWLRLAEADVTAVFGVGAEHAGEPGIERLR